MHLLLVGLNHKTASLGLREQFVFDGELMLDAVGHIIGTVQVKAAVLISTCNRTELYLEATSLKAVLKWLMDQRGIKISDLKEFTYLYKDQQVVRHLMNVACGLDSMVLGEAEILGQLKAAFEAARAQGFVSKNMSKLFHRAFTVAKKVRTQTEIGLNPVSVAYLAVRLAARIFTSISSKRVLILGAGDTAKLVLKHLCGAGAHQFIFANRTLAGAQGMAGDVAAGCSVEYIELGMVTEYLSRADIVITATSAPLPIVGKGMVERAMQLRKQSSMFMIDLSVPRNIEPQVQKVANVYLYCIDDLQTMAAEHKKTRYTAARQAEEIISEAVIDFMSWLQAQDRLSIMQDFRKICTLERDHALQIAKRQLQAGRDPEEVLEHFAHTLLNKIIHRPTVQIRNASMNGDDNFLNSVQKLFKLETETET